MLAPTNILFAHNTATNTISYVIYLVCNSLKKIVEAKIDFFRNWRIFLLRFLALFERSEFAKILQKARQGSHKKSYFCDLFSERIANWYITNIIVTNRAQLRLHARR